MVVRNVGASDWAKRLAAAAVALSAVVATQARASSIRCEGEMRLSECRAATQDGYQWPSTSQPTFSVSCTGCPSPNPTDAGPAQTCMSWPPRASQFTLAVGGQSYSNLLSPVGVPTTYFEETGTECDGKKVFRYSGPLQPGKRHEIDLGGHDVPELPITFYVAQPPNDPTADAGPPADAGSRTDTSSAGAGQPEMSAGCTCSLRPSPLASSSFLVPSLVVAFAAALARRKRNRG